MATIEELKAKHAREIQEAEEELTIAQAAAVTPHRVHAFKDCPWLIYEAPTLAAALDIMKAAPVVPFNRYKGTFTRLIPAALVKEKDGEQIDGPYAAKIHTNQGAGFGPSPELCFFVMAGDRLCQAHVKIGDWNNYQFAARVNVTSRYRDGSPKDVQISANAELAAMCDAHMRWGSGSIDNAIFDYMWMADTEDGGAEHALAILGNIKG